MLGQAGVGGWLDLPNLPPAIAVVNDMLLEH
jgi:hypothetical protein